MGILVTGVAGFIGFSVAKTLLARGEQIIGIDNVNDYYSVQLKRDRLAQLKMAFSDQFTFLELDFSEQDELQRALSHTDFQRIVHLGAQAGVRYSIEHPSVYGKSNLVGHLNMLEICRQRNCVHFVYASSSSVYGRHADLPYRLDDRTDHPSSLYAATKRANELMSEAYSHLYRLSQTGLRFFTVYGPWGRPDMAVWLFTDAILDQRPIKVFGDGKMRRDFTHIDDIVSGTIAVLDNPPPDDHQIKPGGSRSPHRIYNIGNSKSERLTDLISIIEESCGKKAIKSLLPMQPGDVRDTHADISAIERDLKFQPRTALRDGIPDFVRWYENYRSGIS